MSKSARALFATLALVLSLQSTARAVDEVDKREYTSAGINGTAAAASAALAAKGYSRPSPSLLLVLSVRVELQPQFSNKERELAAAYSRPDVKQNLLVLLRRKTSPPIYKVMRYDEMRVEPGMNQLQITVTVRSRDTGKHWIKLVTEYLEEHLQDLFREKLSAIIERIGETDFQKAVAEEVQTEVNTTKQAE